MSKNPNKVFFKQKKTLLSKSKNIIQINFVIEIEGVAFKYDTSLKLNKFEGVDFKYDTSLFQFQFQNSKERNF